MRDKVDHQQVEVNPVFVSRCIKDSDTEIL
jgi:hypothetical protein